MNFNITQDVASSSPEKSLRTIACLFGASLFAFIFFTAIRPISEPDFWWHLKSGEIMWQNRGLLQFDPFTFSGDEVVSSRETLILKGYWLWQLVAYGLYALLGLTGIFLLNFLTLGAMAGVVIQQMRRQQVNYALGILLLVLGFSLLRANYTLERPQVVSFLLAAILVALLARVRDGGRLGWSLPLLMLVWANLHGGFVVGDLILLCFSAGVMIEYRQDLPRLRHLLGWIAIGLGASLLNPTGALAFSELFTFQGSALMTGVTEYRNTWVKFEQGSWSMAILWLLIALYGLGIWRSRRFYWPEGVVALFLALFSLAYVRNVGFFAVAMLPDIGFHWQRGRSLQSRSIPPVLQYLVVIISAVALLWQANDDWQRRSKEGSISAFYPVKTAQFIQTSGLQGKMFNDYNVGGYLLWKLYPQHRVFIDGRGLEADVYRDGKLITAASLQDVGGRKEFEVLLERYGIDYVVQPLVFLESGRLTPLLKFLLVKQEWLPVYADHQCYIMVRNSPINAAVLKRYAIDKREFSNKIIGQLTAFSNDRPSVAYNHIALAEMLIFVSRYAEAEKRLAVIARLQPNNPSLPALRNQLNVLKNGKKP